MADEQTTTGAPSDLAERHAWFARMRNAEPVWFDERTGFWNVFRYTDAARILGAPTAFSSAPPAT